MKSKKTPSKPKKPSPRRPIPNRLRFEVFKRDSFTCQYCGEKAPDVVLHCDHIQPFSKGGPTDILNLVTSCFSCNSGKSDKELSDDSVMEKRRRQLESLQRRKEQIEQLSEWQSQLLDFDLKVETMLGNKWFEYTGYSVTETAIRKIRQLMEEFEVSEILSAMKTSTDNYLKRDYDGVTMESMITAWNKIGGICQMRVLQRDRPVLARAYYVKAIIRKRFSEREALKLKRSIFQWAEDGIQLDDMESAAKECDTIEEFVNTCKGLLNPIHHTVDYSQHPLEGEEDPE